MVVIRLQRAGSHKRPFYHIVVADKRSPRDGRFIERIGFYNPIARGQDLFLDMNLERFTHWQSTGAQPSERVAYLAKLFAKSGTALTKPAKKKKPAKVKPAEASAEAA